MKLKSSEDSNYYWNISNEQILSLIESIVLIHVQNNFAHATVELKDRHERHKQVHLDLGLQAAVIFDFDLRDGHLDLLVAEASSGRMVRVENVIGRAAAGGVAYFASAVETRDDVARRLRYLAAVVNEFGGKNFSR